MKNVSVWSRNRLFLPGAGATPICLEPESAPDLGLLVPPKKVPAPQHCFHYVTLLAHFFFFWAFFGHRFIKGFKTSEH